MPALDWDVWILLCGTSFGELLFCFQFLSPAGIFKTLFNVLVLLSEQTLSDKAVTRHVMMCCPWFLKHAHSFATFATQYVEFQNELWDCGRS